MAKQMIITAESWERVLEEFAKEIKTLLDNLPEDRPENRALLLFMRTLKRSTRLVFDYLPPADREDIVTTCAIWLDLGLMYAMFPQTLIDILARTEATGIEIEQEEIE